MALIVSCGGLKPYKIDGTISAEGFADGDTISLGYSIDGASYTPDDDKHFKIRVNVEVSNMFYSWICGFRKKATILNPPEVVEDFKNFLADINQKYETI